MAKKKYPQEANDRYQAALLYQESRSTASFSNMAEKEKYNLETYQTMFYYFQAGAKSNCPYSIYMRAIFLSGGRGDNYHGERDRNFFIHGSMEHVSDGETTYLTHHIDINQDISNMREALTDFALVRGHLEEKYFLELHDGTKIDSDIIDKKVKDLNKVLKNRDAWSDRGENSRNGYDPAFFLTDPFHTVGEYYTNGANR